MHMEVLHISCNMCTRDLPDMYALSPRACGPRALGIHIRQISRAHVTTITCTFHYLFGQHLYLKILLGISELPHHFPSHIHLFLIDLLSQD